MIVQRVVVLLKLPQTIINIYDVLVCLLSLFV